MSSDDAKISNGNVPNDQPKLQAAIPESESNLSFDRDWYLHPLNYLLSSNLKKVNTDSGENKQKESRIENQGGQGFLACEHNDIGEEAFNVFFNKLTEGDDDKFYDQLRDEKLYSDAGELKLSDTLNLKPGQIIFLGGDFFGPKKAIAEGKTPTEKTQLFLEGYQNLINGDAKEIQKITNQVENATPGINKARAENEEPSGYLHKREGRDDFWFGFLTAHFSFYPYPFLHSRYLELALNNFDHFEKEAKEAYDIGHILASNTAVEAHKATDPGTKLKLVVTALAQELFACHYLTDLFSSGHIRTPRKALYDYVQEKCRFSGGNLALAGKLAQEMHDEDSREGITVVSDKCTIPWQAKGDGCYFDSDNRKNKNQIIDAVVAGLTDIYFSYKNGTIQESAKEHIPREYIAREITQSLGSAHEEKNAAENDQKNEEQSNLKPNSHPLFRLKDGKLEVRENVSDITCNSYVSDWNPLSIYKARFFGQLGHWAQEQKDKFNKQWDDLRDSKCSLM